MMPFSFLLTQVVSRLASLNNIETFGLRKLLLVIGDFMASRPTLRIEQTPFHRSPVTLKF